MVDTRALAASTLLASALCAAQPAMGQDPINGACDESVRNGCSAGTPNDAAFPDGPSVHAWRCDGLNGGTNSGICELWFSTNGVCDESVRNGCAAGRPNDAAFPDTPTEYAWRCDGLNAGANSGRCVKFLPVDGVCDDGLRNGCSAGTANDDAIPDNATAYLWRCDGLHGGRNSSKCHIRVEDVVDGVCDDSVRNGCSAGTANDDAIADTSNAYLWRCDGLRGGENSDKCHKFVPVDGACDDSVRNGCSAGTANDDAIADTSNAYLWRCDGLHGGSNSDKCHKFMPVDGACDDSVRNGCTTGTANDDAIADTSNAYLWRCDGLHGGSNSDKCHKFMPVDGVCDDSVRNGCTAGTANDAAIADNDTVYLWRCDGEHGGRNSEKCHIRVEDVVDGACDESVRNGCSAGTANDDAFPDSPTVYAWRCDGSHGGGNSGRCSKFVPVDGACNDSVRNGCTAGTPNDEAFADNSTGYLWRCDGEHGGRNSSKCFIRVEDVPVDGVCDDSVRNGCAAGTANDGAIPDSSNAYLWRCDGLHGGENSEKCLKFMAVDGGWSDWSACSATACGSGGTQTRHCDNPSPQGGQECLKLDGTRGTSETRACTGNAPVDGGWSAWGSCSAAGCGAAGTQTRTCDNPSPGCGGSACSGPSSRSCTANEPVDGGWSAWSACSASACGLRSTQTRACTHPSPACGGSACVGASSRSCTGSDPRPGGWSAWSSCSAAACGASGTQTRTCSLPSPGCGGSNCSGAASQSCTGSSPRDGGWSAWSRCSATACGESGTQTRRCNLPSPGCGGSNCSGAFSRVCTGNSPRDGVWRTGPWGGWSNCLPSGESCKRTRSRTVTCIAPGCGGADCPESTKPEETDSEDCVCSSCPRQGVSWGNGCSSSVGPAVAGGSATASNTTVCRTGSATFQCSSSGSWGSAANASCTIPAVNGRCGNALNSCLAGHAVSISSTSWQCAGRCGGATVRCNLPPPRPTRLTVSVSVSASGNRATAWASVSGGTAPYTYSWGVAGPAGISGSSSGPSIRITYSRSVESTIDVTVTVRDSAGSTASDTYSWDP